MKKRSERRYSQCCPVCRHRDIQFSSAIDGRAQLKCIRCERTWTEGRMDGEGYKDWPTYRPKEAREPTEAN
jgi:hypothetical protein